MSALGASVGKAVGGLGGPAATTVIVVAGLAAGALGGGFVANGGFSGGQSASSAGKLAVYPCPETGPVIATISAGQQVLTTGRNEDGSWLRIHFPAPGRTEAWVEAGPLTVDGTVSTLPAATCEPELAIAPPSGILPEESMTAVQNNPPKETASPGPTPTATATAGPTTRPTTAPNTRPSVASLTASTRQISFDTGKYCPNAVQRVTFRVRATDNAGVTGVMLDWRKPGAGAFTETPMTRVSGNARDGVWQVTLDTAANGINQAGTLSYFAVARDAAGLQRRIPATGSSSIQVKVCKNTGPTVNAVSQQGNTLFWDPLGSPANCQTATNIIATIKDVDGIKSAILFYRPPGSSSYRSETMDNTTVPGKWYANIDTLGDKIFLPAPPPPRTGSLRWFVRATDKTGLVTNMPAKTIAIKRCDTPATTNVQGPTALCLAQGGTFYATSSDPDGINGSSAVLSYTYTRTNGAKRTVVVPMSLSDTSGSRYFYLVNVKPDATWKPSQSVSWYVQTTDIWGGKTNKGGAPVQTAPTC